MGRCPRPGLSASPSTPYWRKRFAHLYTKRRLIPTVSAMCEIGTPSATSKIIRPRLARPAGIVVERCHAMSVWRSSAARRILNAVLRPRAIKTPPGKSYIAYFFGRMQIQLELLHLFFCSGYATIAPAQRQNHSETLATTKLGPHSNDGHVIFLTSVQNR